jgi:hypothetical protein
MDLVSLYYIITKADRIYELKVIGLTLIIMANSVRRPGIVKSTIVVIT